MVAMDQARGGSRPVAESQTSMSRRELPPRPWQRLGYVTAELRRHIKTLIDGLDLPPGSSVLDFGCGASPYRHLFRSVEYLRADLEGSPDVDVIVQPDGTLPVSDSSVEVVLSTQVLEHVSDPNIYIDECARVLRPGGTLLLSTHGLMYYHPDPNDYWRWTPAGLELMLTRAGFQVKRLDGLVGLTAACLTIGHEPFLYSLPRRLWPPLVLLIQLLSRIADRLESSANRRRNALVFAVVAELPG